LRAFAKRNKAIKERAGLCSLLFGFLSAQMVRAANRPSGVRRGEGDRRADGGRTAAAGDLGAKNEKSNAAE
jgi:hypothetical protein